MENNYPPVAVTASAIAYEAFKNKDAEEKLKMYCTGKNPDISLMTVNYLLYTTNKEPFIETIKQVRKMEGRNYFNRVACMDFLGSLGLVPNHPDHRE